MTRADETDVTPDLAKRVAVPKGAAEALQSADAAAQAFAVWSATPARERAAVLRRASDCLEARAEALVATAARETGSAPGWTRFNLNVARAMLHQAAELCDIPSDLPVAEAEGDVAYRLRRSPAGVVLGIAPWNAPVTLAVRACAAPLALGNTVVLKGSELCPETQAMVADSLNAAGLPEGALSYVANEPDAAQEVVEALISHPAVRRVNFTGSTRVGREIALICARNLKRSLLELSGKGCTVVLADANPAEAARVVAHAAFFNQGQVCMSTDRVIVDERLAEPFLAHLADEAERLRAQSGQRPLGRLINRGAVTRLRDLIADAMAKGAVPVAGGETLEDHVQPTILDRVAFGMRLYHEEVFGPLLGVVRVGDEDEAVSVANDSDFGLAAAVIGGDLARARAVAERIEAGIVHVNGSTVFDDPAMPFGGLKDSGWGRFGGQAAIEEFTELQWLTERDRPEADRLGD